MFEFLGRRLLQSLPVALATMTIVFLLMHIIPGDPAEIMLGDAANASDKENLRRLLGLDQPLTLQYWHYVTGIFSGDWGKSVTYEQPVLGLIASRFFPTFLLTLSALLVSVFVSLPVGMFAARVRGSGIDLSLVFLSLAVASVPIFVVGPIAVLLFSVEWQIFPVSGFTRWSDLALPSLCLGIGISGYFTRIVRTATIEVLNEDFIRTARSKGLSERAVYLKHVLRNASIPLITVLGNAAGALLAGAVVTETLFDWPGIGRLFFNAFQARDYPLVQGIVLWVSIVYLLISIAVDLLYSSGDKRVQRN